MMDWMNSFQLEYYNLNMFVPKMNGIIFYMNDIRSKTCSLLSIFETYGILNIKTTLALRRSDGVPFNKVKAFRVSFILKKKKIEVLFFLIIISCKWHLKLWIEIEVKTILPDCDRYWPYPLISFDLKRTSSWALRELS